MRVSVSLYTFQIPLCTTCAIKHMTNFELSLIEENKHWNASQWWGLCWRLQMLLCNILILVWKTILYWPISMQVTIVTSTTLWDLTVHTHSMPSAFQFQEGVSNYSNPHITFNLNYNCLSQYSIYKKAFHTTTHQIDTSQQMEKSAAPGQRVSFTLSFQNLQHIHVGAQWFWEEIYSKLQFTDIYEVEIFGLAGACVALLPPLLWSLTLFGLFRHCFNLLYACLGHQICNVLLQVVDACAHLIKWGSSSGT